MSVGKIDYYQKYLKYKNRYLEAMRGGSEVSVRPVDTRTFHERYTDALTDINAIVDNIPLPSTTSNDVLFVIDMQNDFSLPPKEGIPPDKQKQGAFYVQDGEEIIPNIVTLINTWQGKIIASIDYHNPKHCSFMSEDSCTPSPINNDTCRKNNVNSCSGRFPPHCMWRTDGTELTESIGATLVESIGTALNNKSSDDESKVDYVYKGFFPDHDSFGASQYSGGRACSRIIQDCKSFYASHTGSYKFKDRGPLDGLYPTADYMNIKINSIHTGVNNDTYQTCEKLLNDKLRTGGNIYVVGLAGDFCVLDTVLNLRETYKDKPTKVYFVLSHTRFAWLPDAVIRLKESPTPTETIDAYGSGLAGLHTNTELYNSNITDASFKPPKPTPDLFKRQTDIKYGAFLTNPRELLVKLDYADICNLSLT